MVESWSCQDQKTRALIVILHYHHPVPTKGMGLRPQSLETHQPALEQYQIWEYWFCSPVHQDPGFSDLVTFQERNKN